MYVFYSRSILDFEYYCIFHIVSTILLKLALVSYYITINADIFHSQDKMEIKKVVMDYLRRLANNIYGKV